MDKQEISEGQELQNIIHELNGDSLPKEQVKKVIEGEDFSEQNLKEFDERSESINLNQLNESDLKNILFTQ